MPRGTLPGVIDRCRRSDRTPLPVSCMKLRHSPPNGLCISCRLSSLRPRKPTFHSALGGLPPERDSAPFRSVGCMRGLGSAVRVRRPT
jgi:hypothetical protein